MFWSSVAVRGRLSGQNRAFGVAGGWNPGSRNTAGNGSPCDRWDSGQTGQWKEKSRFSGQMRTKPDILGGWTSQRWILGRDWSGACGLPCQFFWTMNIVRLSGCPGLALPSLWGLRWRVLSVGQVLWYICSVGFARGGCQWV